jgi:enterochelin esterase-like enzyme
MHTRQANRRAALISLASVLVLLAAVSACAAPQAPAPSPLPPAVSPSPTLLPTAFPTPAFTATPACAMGQIVSLNVPTVFLDRPLHAYVYLPPCYADRPDRRYPVLYLFHGVDSTDQQWISLGIPAAADRMMAVGEIPPFIIVMPYDPSWREPAEDGFTEAVPQELVPAIDAQYRTQADRLHRAAGGLSRGAGWAIRFGLTRPDLFSAIGAHSVVVLGSDGPLIDNWLAAVPSGWMPRISLDIGDQDGGLASARLLEEMLTADNIPHEWHLNTGFHDQAYWSSHLAGYLRWYAAGW